MLLKAVLEGAGYEFFEAGTGEAGLIAYDEHKPDLLLLDVMLPDMTGFEFCAKVRAGSVNPLTPILFCTVRSAVSQLAKGIEAGGTDYVLKPFDPENLLTRVGVALRTGLR